MTGVAGLAVFDSNSLGPEKDTYNVTWSVNSHALISEYRVFYRMKPRHHRPGVEHRETFRTFANSTVKMDFSNQWNSVILPANPGADNPPYPGVTRQKMWYLMRQLQPGTTYEVRVQAKNLHGWNKMSPIFHFTTKSNGEFTEMKFYTFLMVNHEFFLFQTMKTWWSLQPNLQFTELAAKAYSLSTKQYQRQRRLQSP